MSLVGRSDTKKINNKVSVWQVWLNHFALARCKESNVLYVLGLLRELAVFWAGRLLSIKSNESSDELKYHSQVSGAREVPSSKNP